MTKDKLETILPSDLTSTTGGITARWLANHPYAGYAFLQHHDAARAAFSTNHPWAYARMQPLNG